MQRRNVIRSLLAVVALAATATPLAIATSGTGGAVGDPVTAKISPALRALVADGYGDLDIASLLPGYADGDVAYLAQVDRVDAVTRAALVASGARVRHEFPEIGWVALVSPAAAVQRVAALPQVDRLRVDDVKRVLDLDVRYVTAAEVLADKNLAPLLSDEGPIKSSRIRIR